MESSIFVTGIKLVKQQMVAHQALVSVLRGEEVHAVIVIPKRAHRFIDVAEGRMRGVEPGQHLGIVLIAEVSGSVEVAGVAVTLRRGVPVVQVGGHRRESKTGVVLLVYWGQPVNVAGHLGGAVVSRVGWARAHGAVLGVLVIETPDGLCGQVCVTRLADRKLFLGKLVNHWRREREHVDVQLRGLVTSRAGAGIRADCGHGVQRGDGHGRRQRHQGERINERLGSGAGRLVTGNAQVE